MRARTLLIGLDGASFSILDPLVRQGVMAFLQGLLGSGTRATLTSVVPPLTPPAWTSLMTGRTRAITASSTSCGLSYAPMAGISGSWIPATSLAKRSGPLSHATV